MKIDSSVLTTSRLRLVSERPKLSPFPEDHIRGYAASLLRIDWPRSVTTKATESSPRTFSNLSIHARAKQPSQVAFDEPPPRFGLRRSNARLFTSEYRPAYLRVKSLSSFSNLPVKEALRAALNETAGSLRQAFKIMDRDGSGELNLEEFEAGLKTSGINTFDFLNMSVAEVFQTLDDDSSGIVSMSELLGCYDETVSRLITETEKFEFVPSQVLAAKYINGIIGATTRKTAWENQTLKSEDGEEMSLDARKAIDFLKIKTSVIHILDTIRDLKNFTVEVAKLRRNCKIACEFGEQCAERILGGASLQINRISRQETSLLVAVFERAAGDQEFLQKEKFRDLVNIVVSGISVPVEQFQYWEKELSKSDKFNLRDFLAWHSKHII